MCVCVSVYKSYVIIQHDINHIYPHAIHNLCVVYVHECACGCLNRPEEGIRSPEPGIVGGCEPCVCWEPNSGPLKE